jgi:hypothetical protein
MARRNLESRVEIAESVVSTGSWTPPKPGSHEHAALTESLASRFRSNRDRAARDHDSDEATLTRQLAALDQRYAEQPDRWYQYRRRAIEIDLLETHGTISTETACVARWLDHEALRFGKRFVAFPTAEQAADLMEKIPNLYLPAHLRKRGDGSVGQVVPSFELRDDDAEPAHDPLAEYRHDERRGSEISLAMYLYG